MSTNPLRVVAALALVALISVASIPSVTAAEPAKHRDHHTSPTVQEYFWGWSDSGQFTSRTFVHTSYPDQASLPEIVIRLVPANPRRLVHLEFFQEGEWVVETIVRSNSRGLATMEFDPMCMNGTWCDGTYTYRLRIGGLTAPVSVTYVEN